MVVAAVVVDERAGPGPPGRRVQEGRGVRIGDIGEWQSELGNGLGTQRPSARSPPGARRCPVMAAGLARARPGRAAPRSSDSARRALAWRRTWVAMDARAVVSSGSIGAMASATSRPPTTGRAQWATSGADAPREPTAHGGRRRAPRRPIADGEEQAEIDRDQVARRQGRPARADDHEERGDAEGDSDEPDGQRPLASGDQQPRRTPPPTGAGRPAPRKCCPTQRDHLEQLADRPPLRVLDGQSSTRTGHPRRAAGRGPSGSGRPGHRAGRARLPAPVRAGDAQRTRSPSARGRPRQPRRQPASRAGRVRPASARCRRARSGVWRP